MQSPSGSSGRGLQARSTGLALVHAYGTAESYGLEVEQEPTAPQTASRDIIVHGAYALLLWDPGAIYGYKEVPLA